MFLAFVVYRAHLRRAPSVVPSFYPSHLCLRFGVKVLFLDDDIPLVIFRWLGYISLAWLYSVGLVILRWLGYTPLAYTPLAWLPRWLGRWLGFENLNNICILLYLYTIVYYIVL